MGRWWLDIDWNWRNFGRQERFGLLMAALFILLALVQAAVAVLFAGGPPPDHGRDVSDVAVVLTWISAAGFGFVGLMYLALFVVHNRHRRGLPVPQWAVAERLEVTNKTRPISIRALRLILLGGFLALAALLGLLVWVVR